MTTYVRDIINAMRENATKVIMVAINKLSEMDIELLKECEKLYNATIKYATEYDLFTTDNNAVVIA